MEVFRGYDQEQLDRLYDVRRRVPDWETYTGSFERRSAMVRRRMPGMLDLAYGPHPRERLDLFLPSGVRRPPVNLFFHGGYWRSGEKERYSYVAEGFLPLGAAAGIVEYALAPEVDMDELVRQCRAAVAWVADQAGQLGVDGDRIFVSGHSAGGHIVGMLMSEGWDGFAAVKGGCGLSGLYELEPIRLTYLNSTLALDPGMAARNSPALLRPAGAPLLLAVGGEEGAEYLRQTAAMEERLRADGVPCSATVVAGGNHYTIVQSLGDPLDELTRAVHRQMGLV